MQYPPETVVGAEEQDVASRLARAQLVDDAREGERQRRVVKARLLGEPVPENRIDRFLVLEQLGVGGMGVVYAAYDPTLDRKVAIKLVRTWGTEKRAEDEQRLIREARALARLSHPNVVAVYEVGLHEGDVFIAMEFVHGVTLRKHVIGIGRAATLAAYRQAGEGLAAAHAAGIVHRDFKPDNALVGEDGRVRVLDFGIARKEGARPREVVFEDALERDTALTVTGALVGTPAYMPPEQRFGLPATAGSDQYSFCVALHEALAGSLPQLADDVRTPADTLPTWIRRTLARGMAEDPAARWPSMEALLAELARDPTRRRTRIVLATLPVVATAGAFSWHALDVNRREAECDDAAASIASVWDADRRADVESAFATGGATYAADTLSRLAPRLDAYASAWAEQHAAACRNAAQERTDMPAAAVACFDERRAELERLVTRLSEPDPERVRFALAAANELEDPAHCTDPTWLARRPPLPSDPTLRAEVEAVRLSMAGAYGRRAPNEHAQALADAEAILARSEELGYGPLVAAAHVGLGTLHFEQGNYADSAASYLAGFDASMRAGDDATAARAATLVIDALANDARHGEALAWSRTAEGFIARLGLEGTPIDAARLGVTGMLLADMGRYDEAFAMAERARAIFAAELGDRHPATLRVMQHLATVQGLRGDLDDALRRGTETLAALEGVLGTKHPELAALVNSLGVLHLERGELQEAQASFERALGLMRLHQADDHPDVIGAEMNVANVLQVQGEHANARAIYERVLPARIARLGERHPGVADVLSNIGATFLAEGNDEAAIDALRRAHEIRRAALPQDHPEIVTGLDKLGQAYSWDGGHEEAVAMMREASALAERAFAADHPYRIVLRSNLAHVLRRAGQLDAARVELERNLAEAEQAEPFDRHVLADVLLETGHIDEAQQHYEYVAAVWAESTGEASRVYGDAIAGLGEVALARGDHEGAIEQLERAEAILAARDDAPIETAQARFALARALFEGGHDRARALALAATARDHMAVLGDECARDHAAAVAWLRRHGPR